jgi:hypothetical protein
VSPLCYACRQDGMIKRHRHCGFCDLIIWGSDEHYVAHAFYCKGPRDTETW